MLILQLLKDLPGKPAGTNTGRVSGMNDFQNGIKE
jgi:hypothetical protein